MARWAGPLTARHEGTIAAPPPALQHSVAVTAFSIVDVGVAKVFANGDVFKWPPWQAPRS